MEEQEKDRKENIYVKYYLNDKKSKQVEKSLII